VLSTLIIFTGCLQYAPGLFSYIKIAIDNGARPGAFWLTGSQAFQFNGVGTGNIGGMHCYFTHVI
jgi:uncharacterized protein